MGTIVTKKWCNKCKKVRPASKFNKDKSTKTGLYPYCRDCQSKKNSKYYKENGRAIISRQVDRDERRLQQRSYKLKVKYGIDLKKYYEMYEAQQGRCLVCDEWQERLFVDHDHKSEEIRGLLCNNCNMGIGLLKDNPTVLERAVAYIKRTLGKE